MTRILLVGKNGQIGWELHRILQNFVEVIAVGKAELNVADLKAVTDVCHAVKPDIVINATGYNDVDAAERNVREATATNVIGNANLAQATKHSRGFYITYSTDYVFDGQKNIDYSETDLPRPLNVYAKTKLDGELAIKNSGVNFLIFRTSSVFSLRRPCFLSNFLKLAQPGAKIRVRTDLISSPTSARFLAETMAKIIPANHSDCLGFLMERVGIYHLAGSGSASRYEWAQEIKTTLNLNVELIPASSSDFRSDTTRPTFSALNSSKFSSTFHIRTIAWQQLLKETLKELP